MLLQNPNWLDSLNKAKKRVVKAAKVNLNDFQKSDPVKNLKMKLSKETVTDVFRKFIIEMNSLKTALDTASLYKGEVKEQSKFYSKLYSASDSIMTNLILLLKYDVTITYLYWSQQTFIAVSETFMSIISTITKIYQNLVDRGVSPQEFFPNWDELYQQLSLILSSYQQEGGKPIGDTQRVMNQNQSPFPLFPVPAASTRARTTPTSSPIKSSASQQPTPIKSLTSGTKSPKIQSMIEYVANSPKSKRKQLVSQEQLDELKAVVENLNAQLEVEEAELKDIKDILDEPDWKKFSKKNKDQRARDPQRLQDYEDLIERREFTKGEVKDIKSLLNLAKLNLKTAQEKFDDQDFATQASTATTLKPKGRRSSKRLSFGPGGLGGSPGTPGAGNATPLQISQWQEEERALVDELRSISDTISSLAPLNDAADISALETSKKRIISRLQTIETDLVDNSIPILRSSLGGYGRPHKSYNPQKAAHHAWADVFYNINPPKYVKPYNVLLPITRIPKRYL
jgi:hypothetical protein